MVKWIRVLGCLSLVIVLSWCERGMVAEPPKKDKKKPASGKEKPADPKDKTADPKDKTSDPKPPTHKVEKGPFKVEVILKGTFESGAMAEVDLNRLEAWPQQGGMLTIKKIVEHGATVKKGDQLVWLDMEKIDLAIKDMEAENQLADLGIKQAEEELPLLKKAAPVELAFAERAKKIADEDMKSFPEVEKVLRETSANTMVKIQNFYLESEKEELNQLEKMYKAKDLTESTEEIILKRQRKMVEIYGTMVKQAEMIRDRILKQELPRHEQSLQENVTRLTLSLEKIKTSIPTTLNQKELSLAKMKYERDKAVTRLARIKRDREAMTVTAPADGIVYYGKCVRGQWDQAASMAQKLQPGNHLQEEEVFITIVKPRPLAVRAVVEEKDLHYVSADQKGKVVPTGMPDLKLAAKIEKVSAIPITPGNFDARVTVDLSKEADVLMPGMACAVKLMPYTKEETLTVPVATVFAEELDEDKHYVYFLGKENKHEKRPVKVGKKTDKVVEILEGLKEGDEILLEKPKLPEPTPAKSTT